MLELQGAWEPPASSGTPPVGESEEAQDGVPDGNQTDEQKDGNYTYKAGIRRYVCRRLHWPEWRFSFAVEIGRPGDDPEFQ